MVDQDFIRRKTFSCGRIPASVRTTMMLHTRWAHRCRGMASITSQEAHSSAGEDPFFCQKIPLKRFMALPVIINSVQ